MGYVTVLYVTRLRVELRCATACSRPTHATSRRFHSGVWVKAVMEVRGAGEKQGNFTVINHMFPKMMLKNTLGPWRTHLISKNGWQQIGTSVPNGGCLDRATGNETPPARNSVRSRSSMLAGYGYRMSFAAQLTLSMLKLGLPVAGVDFPASTVIKDWATPPKKVVLVKEMSLPCSWGQYRILLHVVSLSTPSPEVVEM